MAILPLDYDSEGRLKLLSKRATHDGGDSIEKRLRRSPDRADSLVLAFAGLHNWDEQYSYIYNKPKQEYRGPARGRSGPDASAQEILDFPDGYREMMIHAYDYLYPGYLDDALGRKSKY